MTWPPLSPPARKAGFDTAAARLLVLAAAVLLLLAVAAWLRFAVAAIPFPHGLVYTEGEVWQQALLIPGPRMYGDITRFPYIGFEYPPLFHVLAKALAGTAGGFLAAGRLVSLLAALAACAGCGWLTWRAAGARATSMLAACLPVTLMPIYIWSANASVDMLAAGLGVAGLACAAAALQRPGLLPLAVLCCVAAVFTKPTFIAAPVAIAIAFGLRAPARAVTAYALGAAVGLAATLWLAWATQGGFLRHVFLYNVNRYRLASLSVLLQQVVLPACMVVIFALVGAVLVLRRLPRHRAGLLAALRGPGPAALNVMLLVWLAGTAGEAMLAGKLGAGPNYFIDLLLASSCFAAIGLTQLADAVPPARRDFAALLCPGLVAVQALCGVVALTSAHDNLVGPTARENGDRLVQAVRATPGPVLSDDLALLLTAGKEVPIEPFLFVELANAGLWDERPYVAMIRQHRFGAVVTLGDPGDPVFDGRFSPAVVAAMVQAYPHVVAVGDARIRK